MRHATARRRPAPSFSIGVAYGSSGARDAGRSDQPMSKIMRETRSDARGVRRRCVMKRNARGCCAAVKPCACDAVCGSGR